MIPYIDIHTHGAPEEGIIACRNVRIRSSNPNVPADGLFSAGIHPWDVTEANEIWLDLFDRPSKRLIAVGETGLDHRETYRPYDLQAEWFERQIGIANRLRKPLIIHSVHAMEATAKILHRQAEVPALLHGYTGSVETLRQWLRKKSDMRFSFGPYLLRSPRTQETLRFIANELPGRLFLETDDAPPGEIKEIYRFTAELTGWPVERLKQQINENFNTLFNMHSEKSLSI